MAKRECILIVDDDSVEKKLLKKMLIEQYDIITASNGREAMEIIKDKSDTLALMILDIYMPEMDGYAVLKELAKNREWKKIPVVVSTAESSLQSDQYLLELGAYSVFHKPIETVIVRQQVANIIERSNKHQLFMKDYLLQENLIHKAAKTRMCVYHFHENSMRFGDHFEDFFGDEFEKVFEQYPFKVEDFVLPKNLEEAAAFFAIREKEQLYDEMELRLRIDAVHYEWFKMAVMIQCDEEGNRETAVLMFTNIENEIEAKEKLTFMAQNDPLTHIPNRRTFADDVRNMIETYPDEDFCMITMDIDQFRMVSKLFGFHEGDNVLRYLAIKLQELMESFEKGVYCRMSSDIFYACVSEQEDIQEFVDKLQRIMRNYPLKFDLKLYFGIYKIVDREESVELMGEHASYARRAIKKSPFKNVQYYDEALKEKEYFESFVVSEKEHALESGEFEVFFQPKVNLRNEKIIGAEALIRWNHPEKGYMSPGIFVPIFEQNGFITELDYFVCESVCKKLREWIDKGITPVPVSINVSRCDLYDNNLFERMYETVERYQIPRNLIEFEITESAFILESKLLSGFTQELRSRGFCVLIDDFGSGYSSLNSLKNIEVDVLKIDIAFLPLTEGEVKSRIILASVIDMSKKLGLRTVAEGVETKEQINLMAELGCEEIQGYYYYRPMPVKDYEQLL